MILATTSDHFLMPDEVVMQTLSLSLEHGAGLRMLLAPHQLLSTHNAHGGALEILRGSVWVTFERDGYDHFLRPGERLPIPASGRALIEALEESDLRFVDGSPAKKKAPPHAEELAYTRPNLQVYPPSCWRNFVSGRSTQRMNIDAPF
jgi:quercetin dioxygenase-like cupin family protein